jgi:integrase
MPRDPKPWYRTEADAWYVTVGGKQHLLARGKANRPEAVRAFHTLMVGRTADGKGKPGEESRIAVATLFEIFLDEVQRDKEPLTYATYRQHLKAFAKDYGGVPIVEIKPLHLTRWLAARPGWADSTRACAITTISRAFNWAAQQKYLDVSPMRGFKKPRMTRRERLLEPAEVGAILDAIPDRQFRDFFVALVESGCRPGEAAKVEAKHVDLDAGTWTIKFKGDPERTIYLTPKLKEITARLMAAHPEGPIFRNTRGTPWTRQRYGSRLRFLRAKLGLGDDLTAYLVRHYFATDGLERGIPDATVAELMGHKGTDIIHKHYSHIRKKRDHLRDALGVIRPPDGGPKTDDPRGD